MPIGSAPSLLAGDTIELADLHLAPPLQDGAEPIGTLPHDHLGLQDHLDHVEKQAILDALHKTRFNRTAAAKLLGVTFRSLRYRMQRLGLNE